MDEGQQQASGKLPSSGVDLFQLIQELWRDRALIVVITGFAAIVSVVVALWLPNLYKASTLLQPQSGEGDLGSLARKYGGLASLAGIALPSNTGESKTALAIEILQSKQFAYEFTARHDLLPALFAAEDWDWESKSHIKK